MIFKYKVLDEKGEQKEGEIDAASKDLAISALQRRGLIVLSVTGEEEKRAVLGRVFGGKVPVKDVVILSRQISTLFNAQVSALKAFSMLAAGVKNDLLRRKLNQITEDIQAGVSISGALGKHPDTFSDFYVNMVKAGEESGKLNQSFAYLAEYLDRQYALTTKTRNALIYPAFVIFVFIAVMVLMLVLVIPKLSQIILESGQEVPLYTKVVIATSDFFVNYGIFLVILLVILGFYGWSLSRSERGKHYLDTLKLQLPAFGELFKKLYLSRISDNLNTMLSSGISILRSIEITADVVGNRVYGNLMRASLEEVKGGASLSDSLGKHEEIPPIMVQMVKVGEETGALSTILKTLSDFYKREVDEAVDTLVGLIEPFMIVALGLGVGILLASVLVPIYNIAGGIA
jgi:type IV pilus assembly protein PilC